MTSNLHMNVYAGDNAVALEKLNDSADTYTLDLSEIHGEYGLKATVTVFMTRDQLEELRFTINRVLADETSADNRITDEYSPMCGSPAF